MRDHRLGMQTRADLLTATAALIGKRGIRNVNVRSITSAAGASTGSISYHFDSIDNLIDAAISGAIDEFIHRRRDSKASHENSPAHLRLMIEAGIPSSISDDLRVVYEATHVAPERPKVQRALLLLRERQIALYASVISAGAAVGAFQPQMPVSGIAMNLVALEDAYDLYLLDENDADRDLYVAHTVAFAELALHCSLPPGIPGPMSIKRSNHA